MNAALLLKVNLWELTILLHLVLFMLMENRGLIQDIIYATHAYYD